MPKYEEKYFKVITFVYFIGTAMWFLGKCSNLSD